MFTLLIPTHNEENRIGETIEALFYYLTKHYQKKEFEVLIIDDGSDRTQQKVREFQSGIGKIRLFHFPHRLGKGGALMEGFKKAKGEFIITYDADGAIPPREIPKMLAELKKFDLVIGSRSHPDSDIYGRVPLRRRFASFSFNTLVNLLFNLRIRDTQCGFKGIRKKAAMKLVPLMNLNGFEWDVELLAKAKRHGMLIREIGIEWHHKKEGKVKFSDTAKMLAGIMRLKAEMMGLTPPRG
ncbi:MAG: dolichyl-phosphate beta-glucosyltransferase [Candidatus Micrarchaeota archaeon]